MPTGGNKQGAPRSEWRVESATASAYTIPSEAAESDGTLDWNATTLVIVEITAAGQKGLGYTYAHEVASRIVEATLAPQIVGRDPLSPEAAWWAMAHAVRNIGRPGIVASAISAVDVALWDLKAKLLDLPLVDLLGAVRDSVLAYGSGGFTSEDEAQVRAQLGGWVEQGCSMVKMKIGLDQARARRRVAAARDAVGDRTSLFVDANGAYTPGEALGVARMLDEYGVAWFEEPVTSDDLPGLRRVRDGAPLGMAIADGEYGYDPWYFERVLDAGAVDVLQADATRCMGITGFLAAAGQCEAKHLPLSAHTAPALHLHVGCAAAPVVHVEYFYDHARIEKWLFDGAQPLRDGRLSPDRTRPGHGLTFKRSDAAPYRVS